MPHVVVHYNKALGWVFLAVALGVLLVALALGDALLMVVGGVNVLVALSFLNRTLCEVYDDRIEMKNAFGVTVKTYSFGSLDRLSVDGHAVTIEGTGTLWNLSGRWADANDWRAFADLARQATVEAGS